MVSSTDGSPTSTGWKRRSRAASFSMCLRYSEIVVAPMQRSSPRARAGLSRLAASIAPSAAPAPTRVWSSSMNRMTSPSESTTSLITALSRSSNSPRNLVPAISAPRSRETIAALEDLGHVAGGDPLGEPLGDRGLAHPGLADQHRVVLGPPGEDLHDPPDLLVAADHRVELAGARQLGEVAAVLLERLELVLRVLVGDPVRPAQVLDRAQQGVLGDPEAGEDLRGRVRAMLPGRAAGAPRTRTRPGTAAPACRRLQIRRRSRDGRRLGAARRRRQAVEVGPDLLVHPRQGTPTLASNRAASPSSCSSRARRRWDGSTSGLPRPRPRLRPAAPLRP